MPRAKPGQRFGGRAKGTRNKVNVELAEAAREYTAPALEQLWKIATHSQSDSARVAAIKEILDRGHGKAVQPLAHSGDVRVTHEQALKLIRDRLEAQSGRSVSTACSCSSIARSRRSCAKPARSGRSSSKAASLAAQPMWPPGSTIAPCTAKARRSSS